MNSTCFAQILGQYLARFRNTAQLLAEAQQLGQPTEAAEATLLLDLAAYAWAVRSRVLLLPAEQAPAEQPAAMDSASLHLRLSVIETLLALRHGLPLAPPVEPTEEPAPTPALLQRLASAESRLFHLFGVAPLN